MKWWRRWRKQRACMHHSPETARSYVRSTLTNGGAGKMFWCVKCDRTWFV